ncbi:MAG: methyl-accepting chemotaxis protein [Burkholderiales bacterium]|nr:methyl-accepting chemotaxis protein [Burkholderiales bacterium]
MLGNLKIGKRLAILVGVLSILLLAVGIIGIAGMSSTNERLRTVYEDRTVALQKLNTVLDYTYRNRGRVDAAFYEENVAEALKDLGKVEEYAATLNKAWSEYLATHLTAEEKALADQADAALVILREARSQVVQAQRTQSRPAAYEVFKTVGYRQKLFVFRELLGKLIDLQVQVADAEYQASIAESKRMQALAVGAIALGLVLGIGLAWLIIRSITRPLDAAVAIADRIAGGDLSGEIEVRGKDETALLLQSFSRMQHSLRTLVGEINGGVEQLSSAATELAAAAHQVAQASDAQSEAASSMAASVEEMTVSITHISDRATDTQAISSETGRLSREGGAVVRRSADEMELIAESVNQSATSVRLLGEKSKEIAHIVSVIKDIADQTNLLALNAAIEAARAGEQGRGFAVVADEVRKLSEKTAGSTNEIAAMIQAIADGTQHAVSTMEEGVTKVGAGVALAREAGQSIVGIEDGSARLLGAVIDISSALKEQSQASNDIAKHVERIAQMTEENSVAVRETAKASQALEDLATSLQASAGRFRVHAG